MTLHNSRRTMLVVWLTSITTTTTWAFTVPSFIGGHHGRSLTVSSVNGLSPTVTIPTRTPRLLIVRKASSGDENNDNEDAKINSDADNNNKDNNNADDEDEARRQQKQELVKAIGESMRQKTGAGLKKEDADSASLLDRLNPFKAGQSLRKQIDTALTSIAPIPDERKAIYALDERFSALLREGSETAMSSLERLEADDYIPEVLVVGATGEVGRLVVKRLLQNGRFRVRVLVRDLYTKTLNMLGTGVTYCQGDLNNVDSLEYAVTDVDKIIFCASPPRPDEEQFQEKFREFVQENLQLKTATGGDNDDKSSSTTSTLQLPKLAGQETVTADVEWEQLESVLQVRAQLAEQVDCIGLNNLIQAFLNVRHSDYGTSQAAKRSLFKFEGRPEDFNLFSLGDGEDSDDNANNVKSDTSKQANEYSDFMNEYDEDDDDNDETYEGSEIEKRRDASVKIQTQWMRNQFGHGVFVGRVPKATEGREGGEAAIISSRLRSRQDPENGIDLGTGFAGFICRVCSDGGTYEAFVRTRAYYEDGIEYVCKFSTATKVGSGTNKSRNKFVTVRLPFENFKPVQRETATAGKKRDLASVPPFRGSDVRNIGFRYRSANNLLKAKLEATEWSSFYLALSYIKLYRSQPEPEFVYVSDARVPPVVRSNMVRHEVRQLVTAGGGGDNVAMSNDAEMFKIFDESTLKTVAQSGINHVSSPEETYYKYRGEEIIRSSGLNYAIARVSGYNEIPAAETTTIDLRPSNEEMTAMSRAEIAQVCVSALMDPYALNKSFYVTKKKGAVQAADEDMREKFKTLPADVVA